MKKHIYLTLIFILFMIGCNRDEGEQASLLPQGTLPNLNTNVQNESFILDLGKGKHLSHYFVESIPWLPPVSLDMFSGRYQLMPFPYPSVGEDFYYVFDTWSDGYKKEIRYIDLNQNMNLTANYYAAMDLIFIPDGAPNAKVYIDGFGTLISPGQYGGIPIEGELTITAIAPYGYEFVAWEDGVTDITRQFTPVPKKVNNFYFKRVTTWEREKLYQKGDTVLYDEVEYEAKWVSIGEVPGANSHNAWEELTNGMQWSETKEYMSGDVVVYEGRSYVALWWSRGTLPTDPNGPFRLL